MRTLIFAGFAAALMVAGSAAQAEVAVWRGASQGPALGVDSASQEAGVTVMRGSVAPAPAPVAAAKAGNAAPDLYVSAGRSRLWFYDRSAGMLTVCTDRPTTKIGVRDVSCSERRLDL